MFDFTTTLSVFAALILYDVVKALVKPIMKEVNFLRAKWAI